MKSIAVGCAPMVRRPGEGREGEGARCEPATEGLPPPPRHDGHGRRRWAHRGQPCDLRGAGQERAPERPLLEVEDVWQVADAIADHLRALVLLGGLAGLRRGEMLALRRRHINLLHRTVTVESPIVMARSKKRMETDPKTDAGRRTVRIPQVLADELERHLDKYTGRDAAAVVFVGERGRPLSTATLYAEWYVATDKVGWPRGRYRIHDLRHAAATLYAAVGATNRELMSHVGHASSAAAMRYQHAAQSRASTLADRLDSLARSSNHHNSLANEVISQVVGSAAD